MADDDPKPAPVPTPAPPIEIPKPFNIIHESADPPPRRADLPCTPERRFDLDD